MRNAIFGYVSTIIAWAAFIPAAGLAQQIEPDSPAVGARVDSVFAEYDRTDSPGCALGVIQDGELTYARGYGMANLDLGVALTPASVFRIGSTSKQFTAGTAVLLTETGKLSLNDDIRKYLQEIPDYGRTITVRDLLHHTSGIRDYLGLMYLAGKRHDDWYTDDEALAIIARQKVTNFEPGSQYLYSNSGYFLISQIVKRATGKSLRESADELIFRPLGMTYTHFHDDHNEVVPNRASGYAPAPGGGFRINMTTLDMVGDGGVFTSVEDLVKWDRNFYEPRVGGEEFLRTLLGRGVLTNGDTLDYALGLGHEMYRALPTVRHAGGFVGFRAQMIRFPEQGFTVICLCNVSTANPTQLARRVADIYLADVLEPEAGTEAEGADATREKIVQVSEEALNRVTGHYWNDGESYARRIYVKAGRLMYHRSSDNESELAPLGGDRFLMLDVPARVEVSFELRGPDKPKQMIVVIDGGTPIVSECFEPVSPSPSELREYRGTYYSEELDANYVLELQGGKLVLRINNRGEIELDPVSADLFDSADVGAIRFTRDPQAAVTGFSLNAERVRNLRFMRKCNCGENTS